MQNSLWQNMQKFFFNSQILKKKKKERNCLAFFFSFLFHIQLLNSSK
jgi:hypothetical protein